MPIKKLALIILFFAVGIFSATSVSHAQNTDNVDEVETRVGNVDSGGPSGGNDNLGPGEFEIPFRCNLSYWSWTYAGHSPFSVDINRGSGATDRGDAVLASADGVVYDRINSHGQIAIRHEGNYYTLYAHMQNLQVSEGDNVKVGQKIGEISDAGSPGSYHLHVNHSRGTPYTYANRIKVCYKRYGCNAASVSPSNSTRYGTDYNKGC